MRRTAFVLSCLAAACLPLAAQEWPGFRGPNHDGSAPAGSRFGAAEGAMAVRWRAKLGAGYSGVAVSGRRAVTMAASGAEDLLVALDTATGREAWRVAVGETHPALDGSFGGPISTPVVAGGRVFALGPRGHLVAADLATGRVLWRADLAAREGAPKPHYGFASSPVVAGGVLVAQVGGGQGRAIAGFDPATGARRWTVGDDKVQYQSPVVMTLGGREVVVAAGETSLAGIDPATGTVVFEHPHGGAPGDISVGSAVPVPAGEGRVFVKTHPEKSTMFRLTPGADGKVAVDTLWSQPVLRTTYVVPVYHDGHLYGMNGRATLTCVDAATGEMKWRSREPGDGFPTLVGDQLVVVTKAQTLHVGPASPAGWTERARIDLFDHLAWTAPSVVGTAAYARSTGEVVRVDWTAAPAARPAPPAAATVGSPTFARFVAGLETAADRKAAVDAFLAGLPPGPIVDPPDRVLFLYRGEVKDVGLVSDLIGFRREDPLQRVPGTDLFFYEARVEPGARVSYAFVPDFGKPVPDPRNPRMVPGAAPGTEASSLAMPGWQEPDHLAEAPEASRGRLEAIAFTSASRAGMKVPLQVYLPAGYDAGSRRHPAAYVLDGDGAVAQGLVPRSLDHLMPRRVAPAIVVFLGRVDWGSWKPRPQEAEAATIEALAGEIVPFVDARFRTRAEPGGRAVIGHLWAGGTALRLAFHEPALFGALGMQSLAVLDTDEAALRPLVREAGRGPARVYQDWGMYGHASTRENADMRSANRRFHAFLREKGYSPAGGEAKDGIGWASWRNRTDALFAALFPPSGE